MKFKSFSYKIRSVVLLITGIVIGIVISNSITTIKYWDDSYCGDMPIVGGKGNLRLYAKTENEFALMLKHTPIVYSVTETKDLWNINLGFPSTHEPAYDMTYNVKTRKIIKCMAFSPPNNSASFFVYIDDEGDGFFDTLYYRNEDGITKEFHCSCPEDFGSPSDGKTSVEN